jgi:surface antigen
MIGFIIGLPLRIAFGVFSLFLTILTVPLRILMRNLWLMVILVVVAFLYYEYQKSAPPTQVTPAKAERSERRGKNEPPVVEAVRKHEDGNSAFATDLYALMTEQERSYYSQFFFWAMSNAPSGKPQSWQNYNIAGEITATDSFVNKSGDACRHFNETLKVHDTQQTLSGIACQSDSGKWCKLKMNATPACGLGRKHNFWGDAMGDLKNMF